jgi:plastocyanin
MKKLYLLIMALAGFSATKLIAQTASITTPSSSVSVTAGGTVSFTGSKSGTYNGSGNYNYAWSSTPSTGASFNPATKSTSSSSASSTATFSTAGTYQVTVNISRGSSSATSSATTVYVNPASTVSAGASSSSLTLPTTCATTLNSSFTANGNTLSGYTWTESSSDPVSAVIASPNSASTSVSFKVAGTYNFTVTANYSYQYGSGGDQATSNVSVTVNSGSTTTYPNNLFALSSSGSSFSGFAVGADSATSGMIINGMNSVGSITTTSSSAALGEDVAGYFYFMPNVSNTGNVTLYAMKHDGTSQTSVATADINGSSDNSNLGFVRLGIDPSGWGWILASNNSNTLYLARFQTNQLGATTISVVNSNVGVSGGGSASTFGSGDLAFDKNGTMYALANDANNNTYIYTMVPSLNTTFVTRRWTLVDPNGNNFTGSVNGCAFDSAGSMYISTSNGLYYIDATTINTAGAGTVKTRLAYNGSGFTDLATNIFPPSTTLPITLVSFTATKQGSNALLQWSTQTENNSSYIDIERSSDAVNFAKVGSVSAAGTTNTIQNYQFTDPLAGLSGTVYYRLREVDIDGNSNYSKIIALRLDGSSVSASFSIYPNPFVSAVKIISTADASTEGTVTISNISGQRIYSQIVALQEGQNVLPINNLSNLQPGVYIVQLITNGNILSQKIIKQ